MLELDALDCLTLGNSIFELNESNARLSKNLLCIKLDRLDLLEIDYVAH
jgi:hypothetical protein